MHTLLQGRASDWILCRQGANKWGGLRSSGLPLQDFPSFCKFSEYVAHSRETACPLQLFPASPLQSTPASPCLSLVHFSVWCFYPLLLASHLSSCLSLSLPLEHGDWVREMQTPFSCLRAAEECFGERGPEGLSSYQRHISLWVVNFLFRQPFSSPEARLKLASCGYGKPPGSRAPTGTSSLTFSSLEPPVPIPPLFAHLLFMFPSQGVLGHYVLTPGERHPYPCWSTEEHG